MTVPYEITAFNGKTIERIEGWETSITIYFTDGSTLDISSNAREDHWVSVSADT